MPPNSSASGGFLQPAAAPAPLEGRELLRFFSTLIVGITGLPGDMVRPFWQAEGPNIPDAGDAWAAFKINKRPADTFPFIGRLPYGVDDGNDHLQRHEFLELTAEFYDLGSTGANNTGGLADYYAALLRDGLAVPQNREPLFLNGMGLIKVGDLVTAPSIFKLRWQYRVDFDFTVARQIDRSYPVKTIQSVTGTLYTDGGLPPQPFKTP